MKRIIAFFFIILAVAGMEMCATRNAWAAGVAGLSYDAYSAGGATPTYTQSSDGTINNRTKVSSGVVSTVNYNWGGGSILNSGRSDGTIVRFYGWINIPTAGTYWFGGNADDGIRIKVNNTMVVNSWQEDGGSFRQGSINLSAGVVPIELIYYENGGGALVNLQWGITSWQIIDSTSLATDSTYFAPAAPTLCCGGSSATFTNTPTNTVKVTAYKNRTTADSQIYIEQIGNGNTITVDQTGTKNNHLDYYGNGNTNTVNVKQSSTSTTAVNYAELKIIGSHNTASLIQQSTGGEKSAFVSIADSNNSVLLTQKDSGSHYAEVNLAGGNKNVDILQQGSGNHQAKVGLTGLPVDLSLSQTGSTQQSYSINFNCATAGGCQKISVSQGN